MKSTRRGQETRQRMLEAAAHVFAEHGFRGTTVRAICQLAGTNVAAIKYHFGSKEDLYIETFRVLFAESGYRDVYTAKKRQITSAVEWRDELYEWAYSLLARIAGDSEMDRCRSRLFLWERCYPSKVLPLIFDVFFTPLERRVSELLRLALPPDVPEEELQIWSVSTIAQCTVYASVRSSWQRLLVPPALSHEDWLRRCAEQVTGSITSRLQFRGNRTAAPPRYAATRSVSRGPRGPLT